MLLFSSHCTHARPCNKQSAKSSNLPIFSTPPTFFSLFFTPPGTLSHFSIYALATPSTLSFPNPTTSPLCNPPLTRSIFPPLILIFAFAVFPPPPFSTPPPSASSTQNGPTFP